ncbi:MAG TPA: O-antigen ligase family protein [Polyangia bacterium]
MSAARSSSTVLVALFLVAALVAERWLTPAVVSAHVPALDGRWAAAVAALVLGGLTVIYVRTRQVSLVESAWAAMFLAVAVSAALHPPERAMVCACLPYVLGLAVLWALRAGGATRRDTLVAASAAMLVLALSVVLDARDLWPWRARSAWPPAGLLVNKNFAAEYLTLALPAALVVLGKRPWTRPLLLLPALAIVVIRCRTAWIGALALVVVLVAHGVWYAANRRAIVKLVAGVALAAVAVFGASQFRIRQEWVHPDKTSNLVTLQHLFDLKSGNGQLRMLEAHLTIEKVRATPLLGLGPGGWHRALHQRNVCAHSDYIRVLADGGVVALAALALLYLAMGWAAARRFREAPEELAFVAALAILSFAEVPLFRSESVPLIAALSLPLLTRRARRVTTRDRPGAPAALVHSAAM